MLIFALSKIQEGHEAAAPNKAAYFVPNAKRNIAATAWASGNTPKASIITDWA